MISILITGSNSFVGTSVEKWLSRYPNVYHVDTVDTLDYKWKEADFSHYDIVFHVAGLAHVNPKPDLASLYYKVNCDLAVEIAQYAKLYGVKQFIFMSSMIVYHSSQSLKGTIVDAETIPSPNDFYGDSKLRAENKLKELIDQNFSVTILRPCMIYGSGGKGNFQKLVKLSKRTPVFPAWHNKRSMLYIDNFCEFVKQVIDRHLTGIYHLQNREYADTVEICRFYNPKLVCSSFFNPLVWLGAFFLKPLCKMFANQYYTQDLTTYDFNYQIVSFKDSLKRLEV